jgi:hypothetical protein
MIMPMTDIYCPVCKETCHWTEVVSGFSIECDRCGKFKIINSALSLLSVMNQQQKACISGWIAENQHAQLDTTTVVQLGRLRMPPVGEKANKILAFMAKASSDPGASFHISNTAGTEVFENGNTVQLPLKHLIAVAWAASIQELDYLLQAYLCEETAYLRSEHGFVISPKGWAHLESLRQGNPTSQIGFIAMWFDESMNDAWLALEKGIREAGYEPLRIDQKQHNNKIDDEIVAAIRRSKFVVADFTKQRGGVYFEAGFAKGLHLEVIWICREDDLKEVHFDTRQYNFIVWKTDKLTVLSKDLQNRIEATIGRGPLVDKV